MLFKDAPWLDGCRPVMFRLAVGDEELAAPKRWEAFVIALDPAIVLMLNGRFLIMIMSLVV